MEASFPVVVDIILRSFTSLARGLKKRLQKYITSLGFDYG
jgi:hypothetical protein